MLKLTNKVNTRVLPVEFDYYEPRNLNEAISLLEKNQDFMILAGGLDLLVWIKTGTIAPKALVNIKKIDELKKIDENQNFVNVGSVVTVLQLEKSSTIKRNVPLIWKVASEFSSIQVRSMTTVGGNICSASPASDLATAALALGAELEIVGPSGTRTVPIEHFFLGFRRIALDHSEILARIKFKKREKGEGFGYARIARIYDDIAKVIVAVRLKVEDEAVSEASVALGSVAPKVIRSPSVEKELIGKKVTEEFAKDVAELVVRDISPITDLRSTAEYRREVSKVLLKRALIEAWNEAKAS